MLSFDGIKKKLISQSKYPDFLRKKGAVIGEDCEIYKSANFGSEPYLITIGNHVRINGGVQLVTHDGGYWVLRDRKAGYEEKFRNADRFGRITIHDNVHIGTNAIIMPGVDIGENCIIACGAVVTHNVPANMVFGGVPAKCIETLDEYASKAQKRYVNTKYMSMKAKKKYLLKEIF